MNTNKENFIFFGSPEFAEIILERLIEAGWRPSLVVCNPDRPVGRKRLLTAPPVKQRIMNDELGIKVFQPDNLKESNVKSQMSKVDAEFAIVAAYGKIIPKEILDTFPLGAIGVHPSLLPTYRGPSPIRSAILDGAEQTGTTLYLMDEKMDHGPILAKSETRIPKSETYKKLYDKLGALGGELLVETLPKFIAQEVEPKKQNHDEATYTKFFATEDGFVPQKELFAALKGDKTLAEAIDRKIRALGQEPGVYTLLANSEEQMAHSNSHPERSEGSRSVNNQRDSSSLRRQNDNKGKRVKLLKAHLENEKLVLDTVQVAGKKPQPAHQIPELNQLND